MVKIGIIGGSGLEDPHILKESKEITVKTQYGDPSSPLTLGKISGVDVVILSRHGRKHSISPTKVNNRANIQALKDQGCTHIIATTACGSLREEIKPGHFVFPDQFIDRTAKREMTFYDKDRVAHIPMSEPFCANIRKNLADSAKEMKIPFHEKGTVITIEGPRFSTRAESLMFRQWGADIINMSTVPEAVLAREAGICYAAIAMSTDYDCWRETGEAVDISMVMKTFRENAEKVLKLLIQVIPKVQDIEDHCQTDIKHAVMG